MKKLVSIIVAGLTMVSCVDTVLLPDNKTVEEDFWQTKEEVAMMVNGAYSALATADMQQRFIIWTSRSDELNVNSTLNNSSLNQIYSANIQTTNVYNNWDRLYSVINTCNLVLSKSAEVMDIDPNYMEGDHLNNVGQMKALRALCYFYLVRVFRDVPLVLEPYKQSSQEMNIPQSAPSIVIDQLIADLEEVKNYTMSSQAMTDWKRCGYFTRDGILALLADIYLWKASVLGDARSYDKCIACCDAIRRNRMNSSFGNNGNGFGSAMQGLDDDGFGLNPYYQYYNVFGQQGQQGNDQESLFELQYSDNTGLCNIYYKTANTTTAQPIFYTNSVYAKIGDAENNVFSAEDYKYDVRGFESVYSFNGTVDAGFTVRKFIAQQGVAMINQDPAAEATGNRGYDQFDQNWIFYRVSDVMLMKAEALVQKGALIAKANEGLLAQLENASVADSLEIANQLREVNQQVSACNVAAARLAQIVATRARKDEKALIDSTKYSIVTDEFDGVDQTAFVRAQASAFSGLSTTADQLEIEVMNERARELCFEGKRWFDMLRYNYRHTTGVNYDVILGQQGGAFAKNYPEMLKLIARKYTSGGGSGVTSKMPTEPYLYMPILLSEMEVNPELVQNPVYTDGETMDKNY